jgi:hypothetical protein
LIDVANNKLADVEFENKALLPLISTNMANTHSSINAANNKFAK